MKNVYLFVLAFLILLGCENIPEEIAVSSISLSQPTAEMLEGESIQLIATILPSNATTKDVVWASSKQSVATVTDSGLVSAITEGASTITASAEGKMASCQIIVSKRFVAVSAITLNASTLELVEGDSYSFVATISPENATNQSVSWESSNTHVATIDNAGKLTVHREGNAVITAKVETLSASCAVTVKKKIIYIESLSLSESSLELVKGSSRKLVATILPENTTDKSINWSSSDTNIAVVDSEGTVTAVNGGAATITASSGDKTATCIITVVIPVESVTLSQSKLELIKGETAILKATINPDNTTEDKTVTWSSSNAEVANVDSNGKVTAVGGGSASIVASAGKKQATCYVVVTVPVTSVSLNKANLTLDLGQSEILIATIKPDDATDKSVQWSCLNTAIASVDSNGKVTAIGGGNTIITAKAGSQQTTCSVVVNVPVEALSLNKTELALNKGYSETLVATIKPDNATDKTITWKTTNEEIATVNSNGLVTAIKKGKTTIIAVSSRESISASCEVRVYDGDSEVGGNDMEYNEGEF